MLETAGRGRGDKTIENFCFNRLKVTKIKQTPSQGSLTINPASTVGTSVNLLPSEMPRSWSLPELSRLQGFREQDN